MCCDHKHIASEKGTKKTFSLAEPCAPCLAPRLRRGMYQQQMQTNARRPNSRSLEGRRSIEGHYRVAPPDGTQAGHSANIREQKTFGSAQESGVRGGALVSRNHGRDIVRGKHSNGHRPAKGQEARLWTRILQTLCRSWHRHHMAWADARQLPVPVSCTTWAVPRHHRQPAAVVSRSAGPSVRAASRRYEAQPTSVTNTGPPPALALS